MYKTEATADWQSREEHGTASCHWELPWAHSESQAGGLLWAVSGKPLHPAVTFMQALA